MEDFASLPMTAEGEDEDTNSSVCRNGFTRDRMELVTLKSKNLIKLLFEFCNSWEEVKKVLLSNEMYISSLKFVLGEDDYDAMAPQRLGELIIGRK